MMDPWDRAWELCSYCIAHVITSLLLLGLYGTQTFGCTIFLLLQTEKQESHQHLQGGTQHNAGVSSVLVQKAKQPRRSLRSGI